PGARKSTCAPRTSCPSLKIVAVTRTLSPTDRLIGQRPQSSDGCSRSIRIRGSDFLNVLVDMVAIDDRCPIGSRDNHRDATETLERCIAASDLSSGGTTRRRGVPLRRLARRGGAVVVAGVATRATGRARITLPSGLRLRVLAGAARGSRCQGL